MNVTVILISVLSENNQVTPEEYMKHPELFGITPDKYLGFVITRYFNIIFNECNIVIDTKFY